MGTTVFRAGDHLTVSMKLDIHIADMPAGLTPDDFREIVRVRLHAMVEDQISDYTFVIEAD